MTQSTPSRADDNPELRDPPLEDLTPGAPDPLARLRALSLDEQRLALHNRYRLLWSRIHGSPRHFVPAQRVPPSRHDLLAYYDVVLADLTHPSAQDLADSHFPDLTLDGVTYPDV